jgi:hypothetical protein
MSALNSALGKELRFSVVAPNGVIARSGGTTERVESEPWWAELLRLASGMETTTVAPATGGEPKAGEE